MKAFAVALLGLAVTAPAMAGPYVSTKSEFKGDEEGYSKTVHQARVGYGTKLSNGINLMQKSVQVSLLLMVQKFLMVIVSPLLKLAHQFLSLSLSLQRQSLSTSGAKMKPAIGSLKSAPSTSSDRDK